MFTADVCDAPSSQEIENQAMLPRSDEFRPAALHFKSAQKFFTCIENLGDSLPFSTRLNLSDQTPIRQLKEFLLQGQDLTKLLGEMHAKWAQYALCMPYGSFRSETAIDCLNDYVRTKRFVQAVCAHLEDLTRQDGEIVVVDAGCGPLPILGIAAAFFSPRVKVIALESNPISWAVATEVVKGLGLSAQIEVRNANATRTTIDGGADLIISETLCTALHQEDFCNIMENLKRSLRPNGRCLPERIVIEYGVTADDVILNHRSGYWLLPPEETINCYVGINFRPCFEWNATSGGPEVVAVPLTFAQSDLKNSITGNLVLQTRLTLYESRDGKEALTLGPSESHLGAAIYTERSKILRDLSDRFDLRDEVKRGQIKAIYFYPPGYHKRVHVKLANEEANALARRKARSAFD